jgi:predicted nucleic acid-binding Zn ribbon protein
MSSTLLRLGLWIIVIVVALYVVHETFEDSPIAEMVSMDLMTKALMVGGAAIALGFVLRLFEKGTKAVIKHRCAVCRTPIPQGAIYCRAHLRNILHEEDDRTHMTRIRRQ